jgi:hypothetical protein
MKKFLVLGLALLLLSSALFADDAKVMPFKVGRLYVAPTYSFASGAYDDDGTYKAYDDGSVKLFNLGFALEYGIIDWITAAVQWVPGWTPWSDLKAVTGADDTNTNGVADLFAGAKIQLAGEQAPIKTSAFRFSVAPGVIIPLPGPDFEEELKNMANGDPATLNSMDKHVFAAGARVYFDYIINKYLFINLYNETIFYPIKGDLSKDGPTFYGTKAGIAAAQSNPLIMGIIGEVDYKYKLTFEIEPVFSMPLGGSGIDFAAGLPVNFKYRPAYEYSYSYPEALAPAASTLDTAFANYISSDPAYILAINPNVSFFLTKTPLPLEFKFQYGLPLMGKNEMARNNATLQIKAYFALPGR